jgi:hypothetical protein
MIALQPFNDDAFPEQSRARFYTHVTGEDAKRVAAQLGDAVWGISYANVRENEKGLEVAAPKPLID